MSKRPLEIDTNSFDRKILDLGNRSILLEWRLAAINFWVTKLDTKKLYWVYISEIFADLFLK